MASDSAQRLQTLAQLILRVGLNLQPGQSLLITDPYDLQGVHPEAGPLVEAIRAAAAPAKVETIAADIPRLRQLVEAEDYRAFEELVATNLRRMQRHLAAGGAFLFLPGTHPRLFSGQPVNRLADFDAIKWRHLGPLIQRLIRGATQWTLFPLPNSDWAELAGASLAPEQRLPALWDTVFQVMRITTGNNGSAQTLPADAVIAAWQSHLAALARRRDELNAAKHRRIRYTGPGTELTVELPRSRVWCTAQLKTRSGVPFVVNLPTEEIFTAPKRRSATGRVRVVRPVSHGGCVIEGIELEFRRGRVATAIAATNADLLQRLLATDDGADRIGEVAIVPGRETLPWAGRFHHHTLLDENAAPHIALGDSYRFCSRAVLPLTINTSQIHIDLPLDAKAELL